MTTQGIDSIDSAALRTLTRRLRDGASDYEPRAANHAQELPERSPGEALARSPRVAVGPRAVILDCGTSRVQGFTHVLLIASSAELLLGSHIVSRLGLVVGRVVGVETYAWEGSELLHVKAPGLDWEDLLREAQDALGDYLASA